MKAIVIDDEQLALESMARMLQRMGVEVAASYQNPLEALKADLWPDMDAAFVDISMPGMNGIELAARLQSKHPELHIVFVTAYDQYAVKAFEIAAADYLIKPVRASRLESTLERIRKNPRHPEPVKTEKLPVLVCMHDLGIDAGAGKVMEIPWRTSKAKELFAYLLHERNKPVTKEHLQDMLWQEADADKAMANLHTTVYQIRQTLKSANLPVQILYAGGRYRLELGGVKVDCEQWEQALDLAVASTDEGQVYRLLLDGYRGDYLQVEAYLWAENERERLRIKWLQRASELAQRLEQVGLAADAIRLYQEIQYRFPTWEACYLGLMRTYDQIGNASEVKSQYAKLLQMLEEDLGMQPDKETTAWYTTWSASRSGGSG